MTSEGLLLVCLGGGVGIAVSAMLRAAFFTVEPRRTVILERFGKFLRAAGPGVHFKIPLIDRVKREQDAPRWPEPAREPLRQKAARRDRESRPESYGSAGMGRP